MIISMTILNYREEANVYLSGDTLYFDTSRSVWVPNYVYYMVEHWNSKFPNTIEYVCFTVDGAFTYKVANLKGKQEWLEVGGE